MSRIACALVFALLLAGCTTVTTHDHVAVHARDVTVRVYLCAPGEGR